MRRCSEPFAKRFSGVWRLSSHQYSNMVLADKKMFTQMPKERHSRFPWLAEINAAPSRKSCFVFFFSPCSKIPHLFLVSLPLNTTCAGTPAFRLVADVVSARNIRSLRWFPHFNYNATWRTELLVSKGPAGKQNAPRRPLCGQRREGGANDGPAAQRQ